MSASNFLSLGPRGIILPYHRSYVQATPQWPTSDRKSTEIILDELTRFVDIAIMLTSKAQSDSAHTRPWRVDFSGLRSSSVECILPVLSSGFKHLGRPLAHWCQQPVHSAAFGGAPSGRPFLTIRGSSFLKARLQPGFCSPNGPRPSSRPTRPGGDRPLECAGVVPVRARGRLPWPAGRPLI